MAYFGHSPYRPRLPNESEAEYAKFVRRQERGNSIVALFWAAVGFAIVGLAIWYFIWDNFLR